jgi:formylglycine-generating enzyme required for sulfatase activity
MVSSRISPKEFTNRYGIELVYVSPGEFMMGSEREYPVHRVRISSGFYIGRYEVTQRQWLAAIGSNPSHFKGENLPVERVSHLDAQTFLIKLNRLNDDYEYRLPTEAEWEYACRAGTTGDFYGNPGEKHGTRRPRISKRIPLAPNNQTPLAYTTCLGMFGSGV